MTKYIQDLADELKGLKKGMAANAAKWTGLPVTEANLQTAIDALLQKDDAIDSADTALKQVRAEGRNLVQQYAPLAAQVENLAAGLHQTEPQKLGDYGIQARKDATTIPIPSKAIIASIADDTDGIGFTVTIQPLANVDTFDIERGIAASADATALATPFEHWGSSKKLSFTDDDVVRGKRYFYRVRGFNRNGYGEWSEPVSRVQ